MEDPKTPVKLEHGHWGRPADFGQDLGDHIANKSFVDFHGITFSILKVVCQSVVACGLERPGGGVSDQSRFRS